MVIVSETRAALEAIAAAHNVTVDELAADVYDLALFIQEAGNKGIHVSDIEARNVTAGTQLKHYFLNSVTCKEALDGILFFAEPRRRSDFNGWYVKKRPEISIAIWEWARRWLEVYEPTSAAADALRQAIEAARKKEAETPKRQIEKFSQGNFEDYTTLQIGHRAACAQILYERANVHYHRLETQDERIEVVVTTKKKSRRKPDYRQSPQGYFMNVWRSEYSLMNRELYFRMETGDTLAAELLDKGSAYFFTAEFKQHAIYSEAEPDLMIDPEHLPTPAPDKIPVRFKTTHQLVTEFMALITADEAGTTDRSLFDYEDRQLILKNLRILYARSKGQKPNDEPTIINSGEGEQES